jgi:hypothetical protein
MSTLRKSRIGILPVRLVSCHRLAESRERRFRRRLGCSGRSFPRCGDTVSQRRQEYISLLFVSPDMKPRYSLFRYCQARVARAIQAVSWAGALFAS